MLLLLFLLLLLLFLLLVFIAVATAVVFVVVALAAAANVNVATSTTVVAVCLFYCLLSLTVCSLLNKIFTHEIRCDIPARAIANALRDICKKILIERSLAQSSSKLMGPAAATVGEEAANKSNKTSSTSSSAMSSSSSASRSTSGAAPTSGRLRPTSLGSVGANSKLQTKTVPAPESFPTPMEEPRKVIIEIIVVLKSNLLINLNVLVADRFCELSSSARCK